MRPGEFELDLDGVMRVLSADEAMQVTKRKAAAVVAEAQATGPRGPHGGGHEIDKIQVGESRVTADGAITAIDWPSSVGHIIERGSAHSPPYRPLTRSAQDQGLRVVNF